jgi:mevalonate kinase
MKTRGAASGKVILLGEHLVVYGAPALASGIDRGARAEAELLPEGSPSELALAGEVFREDPDAPDMRARAFARLLAAGARPPPLRVTAESDLPPGGGLGSSAALGVAIGRAVNALTHLAPSPPETAAGSALAANTEALRRAEAWELVFHGRPSGIDTAASATGGCLRYMRKGGITQMSSVALGRDIVLCVGLSGEHASTEAMVASVARLKDRHPDSFERTLVGVTSLVENAALAIESGDIRALGKLMDLNQMLLAGLMVSTESIEVLCSTARAAGALGAKLTGAGGGGAVIALIGESDESDESDEIDEIDEIDERAPCRHPARDEAQAARVLGAWKDKGFDGFTVRIRKREAAPST